MFVEKNEKLFWQLYNAKNEGDIDGLIAERPDIFDQSNWHPLGGIENNTGVVEDQQSNPVAALVEKLTNSIDAILMRRCYEEGIDPKSPDAPRSIDDAIDRFFPRHKDWDFTRPRSEQARSIQILADGSRRDTSIIIYDDGEGQHPEDFEDTFLSLLGSNKNEIHFVQGRYNMGGTGAIVFCGKKRYQLIASKRYDGKGKLGFTLIRRHPHSSTRAAGMKNPWYEYLKIDGQIPAFDIQELGLGLHRRNFHAGTIVKLYSYDVHSNRLFNLHMAQSLNEFLHEPALPITIVESKDRYARKKGQVNVIFGLKRDLERSEYVETSFSDEIVDGRIGKIKVFVYVFKARAKDKNLKETRETIRNEYFKNGMQVLFSMNGQVHGHYTSEFISRTLKFNFLKDYLLVHVDCTNMKTKFRRKLFKASRDRLAQSSKESSFLRQKLGDALKKGQLRDIYKQRKDRLPLESGEGETLLKQLAENLPINKELQDLIKQTFELDKEAGKEKKPKTPKPRPSKPPFNPKRYPSFFRIDVKKSGSTPVITVPLGGSKTVQFDSDVENQYFDRVDDPGDMKIAIMTYTPNDATGGDQKGTVNDISDIFSVSRKSPQDGKIKIVFEPTDEVQVGDEVEICVDLTSPHALNGAFSQVFWIKATAPPPKKPPKEKPPEEDEKLGLPNYRVVFEHAGNDQQDVLTWETLEDQGIEMNHAVVMHPLVEGDVLNEIYINMSSRVLKKFKSKKQRLSEEQNQLADRRYITSVYFHTLFLYVINKKKNYSIRQMNGDGNEDYVDPTDYLKDLFQSYYAEFLLNFEISELMEGLG